MTDHTRAREALAEIERGLEGVTPGPWTIENNVQCRGWIQLVTDDFEFGIPTTATDLNGRDYRVRHRSFNHIARCDPDTLASIIALVKAQDAEIARLKLAIVGGEDAPGFAAAQPVEFYEEVCRKIAANESQTSSLLAGFHQICTENGFAPSSSELIAAARRAALEANHEDH